MADDNKMIPGGITFGPEAPEEDRARMRRMLEGIPFAHRHGECRACDDAKAESARLRAEVESLRGELATLQRDATDSDQQNAKMICDLVAERDFAIQNGSAMEEERNAALTERDAARAERDGFRNGQEQVQHLFDLLWKDTHGAGGFREQRDAALSRAEAGEKNAAAAIAEAHVFADLAQEHSAAEDRKHLALVAAESRLRDVQEALRGLLLAVERDAFLMRWADEAGKWASRNPPDVELLIQAHDRARALASGVSPAKGG